MACITRGWACVDHLFFEPSKLELSSFVPVAPIELVQSQGAPSSMFASDHAAIVVDFASRAKVR